MKTIFVKLILFYKRKVSPIFSSFGINCKYYPTCSDYAIEAISKYGFFKGWWLAIKRICRCSPWGSSGYDPVPPKR